MSARRRNSLSPLRATRSRYRAKGDFWETKSRICCCVNHVTLHVISARSKAHDSNSKRLLRIAIKPIGHWWNARGNLSLP